MLIERKEEFYTDYNNQLDFLEKRSTMVDVARFPDKIFKFRQTEIIKNNFEKNISKLNKEIDSWKQNHTTATKPFQFISDPSELNKVQKRDNIIAKALRVSFVAGGILLGAGVILCGAGGVAALAGYLSLGLLQGQFAVPLVVTSAVGMSSGLMALTSGALIFFLPSFALAYVYRKENAVAEDAFKEFTTHYFPENGDFHLDKKMIYDSTLHKKYHQYISAFSSLLPKKL